MSNPDFEIISKLLNKGNYKISERTDLFAESMLLSVISLHCNTEDNFFLRTTSLTFGENEETLKLFWECIKQHVEKCMKDNSTYREVIGIIDQYGLSNRKMDILFLLNLFCYNYINSHEANDLKLLKDKADNQKDYIKQIILFLKLYIENPKKKLKLKYYHISDSKKKCTIDVEDLIRLVMNQYLKQFAFVDLFFISSHDTKDNTIKLNKTLFNENKIKQEEYFESIEEEKWIEYFTVNLKTYLPLTIKTKEIFHSEIHFLTHVLTEYLNGITNGSQRVKIISNTHACFLLQILKKLNLLNEVKSEEKYIRTMVKNFRAKNQKNTDIGLNRKFLLTKHKNFIQQFYYFEPDITKDKHQIEKQFFKVFKELSVFDLYQIKTGSMHKESVAKGIFIDAYTEDKNSGVEIKIFKGDSKITLPMHHYIKYFLILQIHPTGEMTEIYNGRSQNIKQYLKIDDSKYHQFVTIDISIMKHLHEKEVDSERIKRRES
jgi:hypothetical protein